MSEPQPSSLNPQPSDAIDRICAQVSDDTAKLLLDIARGLTSSPLGTGDGNLIRAQRLLEARLAGKTVVIEGGAQFQRLIAECAEEKTGLRDESQGLRLGSPDSALSTEQLSPNKERTWTDS